MLKMTRTLMIHDWFFQLIFLCFPSPSCPLCSSLSSNYFAVINSKPKREKIGDNIIFISNDFDIYTMVDYVKKPLLCMYVLR